MNYEKMMEWEECECTNMRKQRYKLHNRVTRIRVIILIQLCTSNEIQKNEI